MSHSKMARRGHYASRSQGEWFALCSEYDRRSNLKESREQFCVRVGINASSFAGNYRKFKAGFSVLRLQDQTRARAWPLGRDLKKRKEK